MLLTSVLMLFTKVEYTISVKVRTVGEKKIYSIKMAKLFKNKRVFSPLLKEELLHDKLGEQPRCSEFCVLIGCPSGQTGAILPARDCPFCSRNKFAPKYK